MLLPLMSAHHSLPNFFSCIISISRTVSPFPSSILTLYYPMFSETKTPTLSVWIHRLVPASSSLGFFPRPISFLLHNTQTFQHSCPTKYHAFTPRDFAQALPWNALSSLVCCSQELCPSVFLNLPQLCVPGMHETTSEKQLCHHNNIS